MITRISTSISRHNLISRAIESLDRGPEYHETLADFINAIEVASPGFIKHCGGAQGAVNAVRDYFQYYSMTSDAKHDFSHAEYEVMALATLTRVKIEPGERLYDYLMRLSYERPWVSGRVTEFILSDFGSKAYEGMREYLRLREEWVHRVLMSVATLIICLGTLEGHLRLFLSAGTIVMLVVSVREFRQVDSRIAEFMLKPGGSWLHSLLRLRCHNSDPGPSRNSKRSLVGQRRKDQCVSDAP